MISSKKTDLQTSAKPIDRPNAHIGAYSGRLTDQYLIKRLTAVYKSIASLEYHNL